MNPDDTPDCIEALKSLIGDEELDGLHRRIMRSQMQHYTGEQAILPTLFFVVPNDCEATDLNEKFQVIGGVLAAEPDLLIKLWNDPLSREELLYKTGRNIGRQHDEDVFPVALFLLTEGLVDKKQVVMAMAGRTIDGRAVMAITNVKRDAQDYILFDEADFNIADPSNSLLDVFYEGYFDGLEGSSNVS